MRIILVLLLGWLGALLPLAGHADLLNHYDFSDGVLLDDETGNYPFALVQNGTNSIVLHPDGYAMFPGTEAGEETYLDVVGPGTANYFTLSFWFRTDDLNQGLSQGLFANNNSSAAFSFQIHLNEGQFGVVSETGVDIQYPATNMVADTWYHVVLRKDSDATNLTELYLTALGETNAFLIGEDPLNPGGFQRFRLGVNRGSNRLLKMDLANVKIYNDATVDIDGLLQEGPFEVLAPTFSADDYYVEAGTEVTLNWVASNATSLVISPDIGEVTSLTTNGVGEITLPINATTTYTLTMTADAGLSSKSLRIGVGPPRPNILLFLVDDMGVHDTSVPFLVDPATGLMVTNAAFQRFYQTPNMMTLATNGMTFTQAYACPVCTPTRTCLMTGHNVTRHGLIAHVPAAGGFNPSDFDVQNRRISNNWRSGGIDETYPVLLPQLLADAGYRTIHCGKAHFTYVGAPNEDPRTLGFDVNIAGGGMGQPGSYLGTANYGNGSRTYLRPPGLEAYHGSNTFLTKALTLELNKELAQAAADDVPFFAYMAHYAVHSPFTSDPDATGDYRGAASTNHGRFATMIEGMDRSLGEIMQQLETLGLAEDTLILFMGDNGSDSPALGVNTVPSGNFAYPMRGKKGTRWEGGSRVPLLAAWSKPNAANPFQSALPIAAGSREDDLVAAFDVMPTILSIAGQPIPTPMDGFDLTSYLRGEPGMHRPDQLLVYQGYDHRNAYFAWWRDAEWKLIYTFEPERYELFNLASDPTESADLAATQPERVMTMARAMAQSFDESWGDGGHLWPAINREPFVSNPARPLLEDDPFTLPQLPLIDLDQDRLPDNAEDTNQNGLVDPGETDPSLDDTDADGTIDGAEVLLGIDPLDPAEAFRVNIDQDAGDQIVLRWPSLPGTAFDVQAGTTAGNWTNLMSNISAHAVSNATEVSASPSDSAFKTFRVEFK